MGGAALFMGIVTAILPDAAFLFAVLLGFAAMIALHYFTWGRWLSRVIEHEAPEDEPSWPQPPIPPEG